jgi:hypothetical protein
MFAMPVFVTAQVNKPPAEPQTEVVALRAQLETMRSYQDRFIAIVLWALGTVITIALGLAAFGWYTNKTTYERDRDALRQERETLRHELRALLSDEIRRVSQELTASLSEREKSASQATEKSLDAKLEKLNSRMNSIAGDVLDVQHDTVVREAEEALRDKRYAWALYKYSESLESSVKRRADHYEVGDTLDEMRKILDIPDVSLDADAVTTTVEALKRLPTRYQAAAESLIRRVKQAQE